MRLARRAMWQWTVAGMIAMSASATIALKNPFPTLLPATAALLSVAGGFVTLLLLAPWGHMRRLGRTAYDIRRLTHDLRRFTNGQRDRKLKEIILERNDELGELSRVVHDTLAHALNVHRESRMLQRTMDHSIQKETHKATHRLRREAMTDSLTGLGNRRSLDELFASLFSADRTRRRDTLIAVAIDMDRFKSTNDILGHDVGDECLRFLGNLLNSMMRREDCAVRLGGDEFLVLMPNLSVRDAQIAAKRLSTLYAQMPWPYREPRPTLSIGIASARCGEPDGGRELLRRADAALYRSKSSGRNCISLDDERLPNAA